jgi:purine/pyrimidine-nucleoside phosphorylase
MLKVNEYFKGAVKSIALNNSAGASTIGVISPGEYEFNTSSVEVMTIITGKLGVKHPGQSDWTFFNQGCSFKVDAGTKFRVHADVDTGYLCLYK